MRIVRKKGCEETTKILHGRSLGRFTKETVSREEKPKSKEGAPDNLRGTKDSLRGIFIFIRVKKKKLVSAEGQRKGKTQAKGGGFKEGEKSEAKITSARVMSVQI